MGERAEGAVADQDVAGTQVGVHGAGPRQVVGPARRGRDLDQEPAGRVKQGQQVHHREAAPRLLAGGLPVGFLQGRRIGHRRAGAVDQEGAMAVPEFLARRGRGPAVLEQQQQAAGQGQGEARPRRAVRFPRAGAVPQAGDVGARRVAVQDLQHEEVDGGHRVEQPLPPGIAEGLAELAGRLRGEPVGDFGLDALDGGEDTTSHPWPPAGVMV